MSYEPVDIYIKDTNDLGNPLEGVVVKVLSENGKLTYGQASTDADGKASFLLPTQRYQLRFFKFAVNFSNPLLVDVLEAPAVNSFNVYGRAHVPPQATDPRLCIASGFFRTASGGPHANLDIHFIAKFDPILLEGAGILSERVAARTDERGFAQVPLIRFAQYDVTIEGMENIYRSVAVPDAAATNLPDLLFPGIKGIIFDTTSPIALAVGAEVEVQARVITTDLREFEELGRDIAWSLSNPSVMSFELLPGAVKIRGLQPGSCELTATRLDRSIVRIPDLPIEGLPLEVVVS